VRLLPSAGTGVLPTYYNTTATLSCRLRFLRCATPASAAHRYVFALGAYISTCFCAGTCPSGWLAGMVLATLVDVCTSAIAFIAIFGLYFGATTRYLYSVTLLCAVSAFMEGCSTGDSSSLVNDAAVRGALSRNHAATVPPTERPAPGTFLLMAFSRQHCHGALLPSTRLLRQRRRGLAYQGSAGFYYAAACAHTRTGLLLRIYTTFVP